MQRAMVYDPTHMETFRTHVRALVKILKGLVLNNYAPEHDVNGVTDPFLQVKGECSSIFVLTHQIYLLLGTINLTCTILYLNFVMVLFFSFLFFLSFTIITCAW